MLTLSINDHGILQRLENFAAHAKNPRALMLAVGRTVVAAQKKHLRDKDAKQPNKLHGPRQHYYNRIADSIQEPIVSADGTTFSVTISDPTFAQKVFGGPISAKNARALTIPQTPESYGRTTAQFESATGQKLFFIKTKSGTPALAILAANHQVTVEYILTPSVNQEKDPTALLTEQSLTPAILQTAEAVLEQQLEEAGLNP